MLDLEKLTRTDFEPLIGNDFEITDSGGNSARVRLAEVHVWSGEAHANEARHPFTLRFVGDARLRVPQQIYRVEHATLGVMEVFLVQTGASNRGAEIEAVFS
jgi:hypothetical protein